MTIIENRPSGVPSDLSEMVGQARGVLLHDPSTPGGRALPAVTISAAKSGATLPADLAGLPTIDSWIADLSLRDERITLVTRTDVLCSVPVFPVPHGWTAAMAAHGLLVVVLRVAPDGAGLLDRADVPTRALPEPTVLAARVPVCLS